MNRGIEQALAAITRPSCITEKTEEWGVGPVSLDVAMARRHGWSAQSIELAARELRIISVRETHVAHWSGPVEGCPCETCDFSMADEELAEPEGRELRARWKKITELDQKITTLEGKNGCDQ